jgi:hypothetical protein
VTERNNGKQRPTLKRDQTLEVNVNKSKGKLEGEVDELFKLPLSEFIGARKTLAARLKKEGQADQANRVQALAKPSVSAWVVNQLYWEHRDAFDRLVASGEDFRRAQSSRLAGKTADLRAPLEARREALSELTKLATALLEDADHNPTLDMIRRITTTLEGVSAYASLPDDLAPGRLTHDVDPPGFDTLGGFATGTMPKRTIEPEPKKPVRRETPATKTLLKAVPSAETKKIEKKNQAKVAAAKAAVQEANRALIKARTRAVNANAAQKKADADAKQKEHQSREAEKLLARARAASDAARGRAQTAAEEAEAAAQAVRDAEESLEMATQELDDLG